jgi:nucleoside-diphosphate-sugar epimerase
MSYIIYGCNSFISKSLYTSQDRYIDLPVLVGRMPLDNLSQEYRKRFIRCNLSADLSDDQLQSHTRQLKELIGNARTKLLLFAWSGTPRTSIGHNILDIYRENRNITNAYCELVRRMLPQQVVFISTAGGVYRSDKGRVWSEDDVPCPETPYGEQKLACEKLLQTACEENGTGLLIYRVASAYGYNAANPRQGVINAWMHEAALTQQITAYNSLDSVVNFISIKQVAEAIKIGLERNMTGLYNLGTSHSTRLDEIKSRIEQLGGYKSIDVHFAGNEYRHFELDCSKFYNNSGVLLESSILRDASEIWSQIYGCDSDARGI